MFPNFQLKTPPAPSNCSNSINCFGNPSNQNGFLYNFNGGAFSSLANQKSLPTCNPQKTDPRNCNSNCFSKPFNKINPNNNFATDLQAVTQSQKNLRSSFSHNYQSAQGIMIQNLKFRCLQLEYYLKAILQLKDKEEKELPFYQQKIQEYKEKLQHDSNRQIQMPPQNRIKAPQERCASYLPISSQNKECWESITRQAQQFSQIFKNINQHLPDRFLQLNDVVKSTERKILLHFHQKIQNLPKNLIAELNRIQVQIKAELKSMDSLKDEIKSLLTTKFRQRVESVALKSDHQEITRKVSMPLLEKSAELQKQICKISQINLSLSKSIIKSKIFGEDELRESYISQSSKARQTKIAQWCEDGVTQVELEHL